MWRGFYRISLIRWPLASNLPAKIKQYPTLHKNETQVQTSDFVHCLNNHLTPNRINCHLCLAFWGRKSQFYSINAKQGINWYYNVLILVFGITQSQGIKLGTSCTQADTLPTWLTKKFCMLFLALIKFLLILP